MKSMDEKYVRDNDVIDRYLQKKLEESELSAFEVLLMDNKKLFEEVQLSTRLLDVFKKDHEQKVKAGPRLPFVRWVTEPFSIAASILVTVFFFSTVLVYDNEVPGISERSLVNSNVLLEATRSGQNRLLSSGLAPLLITIDAGPESLNMQYEVVISNDSNQRVVLQQSDIVADAEGWIRLIVDQNLEGDYSIDVRTMDSSTTTPQQNTYHVSFSQ